jgi:hypothetical protein
VEGRRDKKEGRRVEKEAENARAAAAPSAATVDCGEVGGMAGSARKYTVPSVVSR